MFDVSLRLVFDVDALTGETLRTCRQSMRHDYISWFDRFGKISTDSPTTTPEKLGGLYRTSALLFTFSVINIHVSLQGVPSACLVQ